MLPLRGCVPGPGDKEGDPSPWAGPWGAAQAAGVGGNRAPGQQRVRAGLRGAAMGWVLGHVGWGVSPLAVRGQSQAGATLLLLPPAPGFPSHRPSRAAGPDPPPQAGCCSRREAKRAVGAALTMVPMLYVAAGPMVWWYGSAAAYTLP